jgi:hypothetical protein
MHIYTQTNGRDFMKYAVEMDTGAMIYIPNFIKTGSFIKKLVERWGQQRHTGSKEIA